MKPAASAPLCSAALLPADVTTLILKFVFEKSSKEEPSNLRNLLQLRLVCRSWKSATANVILFFFFFVCVCMGVFYDVSSVKCNFWAVIMLLVRNLKTAVDEIG
jgi:hypothetical protein